MGLRLDAVLVEIGLVKSRERAKELIKNGGVTVNDKVIIKPSFAVKETDDIEVVAEQLKYVSRGGLKLEKAIEIFKIDVNEKTCVDLGASTGGFTDCLLQNGAQKVYAVDVGHDQLDESLRDNIKVVNIEGVNVKDFSPDLIEGKVDIVTADLSFISLRKSLDVIKSVLKDKGISVVLIKPQFEVGKSRVGKGGIVKDRAAHVEMLTGLLPFAEDRGFEICGITCSSIKGGDGNIEYLALLKNQKAKIAFLSGFDVKKFVNESFESMK